MEKPVQTMLFLALMIIGQAEARGASHSKVMSLMSDPKLSPPLKDVKSDKKFFGPPFPADYPEDKRPVVDKSILDKLKGPEQPYPALQGARDYDADFVKDENSDTGAWQAQFEYDSLRRKLAQEAADEKRAEDRAAREGSDVDGAQRNADEAGRKVSDAQNGLDAADGEEKKIKTADDFQGPPSDAKLKELKKAVADAETRYEAQKKQFEECKRQLEAAKKNLEELKVKQSEMEAKLAAETKLWVESKATKFNLKKSKEVEMSGKTKSAQEKLAVAEKMKADMDKALAKQKDEHEKAKQTLQKEQADMDKVKKQLDEASARLQKLHGFKAAVAPTKSGAVKSSVLASMLMLVATKMF